MRASFCLAKEEAVFASKESSFCAKENIFTVCRLKLSYNSTKWKSFGERFAN